MPKRIRLPRIMKDLADEVNIERFMKQRGIDVGSPLPSDARLSDLAAISVPVVTLVASDHLRMGKPNRPESSTVMKHHRINS